MKSAGGGRGSVRDSVVTGSGTLSSQLLVHLRLNGIQAHVLPAILDLDAGECKPVLESSGHLYHD